MLKEIEIAPNYFIREDGKVFNAKGIEKSQRLNRNGYPTVNLWKNNKPYCYAVHRFVAKAFIPNPENKRCVNHIDGNKQNNHVSNLEWVTDSENQIHANKLGLIKRKKGEECHSSKITEEMAVKVCEMLMLGHRNCEIVKSLNVSSYIVKGIRAKRVWKHVVANYDFPKANNLVSEETVRWVCERMEEGYRNFQIVEMANNEKVNKSLVNSIRLRRSHKHISKDYNF